MPDMFEAAMLPQNDPLRQAWERQVAAGSPELQAQWREALAEADALRNSLCDMRLPEGLRASLIHAPARAVGDDRDWATDEGEATAEMEVASMLPPHDPVREAWEARVASAPGDAAGTLGTTWRQLVQESDILRSGLSALVDLPASLEGRVREIPAPSASTRRPIWRWAAAAVAASLLLLAGVGGWHLYQVSADRRGLSSVAAEVVPQYPTPPGLLVESDDSGIVRETLAGQGVDMEPIIIEWRRSGCTLLGGGVTTLNGERAFFTRWTWRGQLFTLYQFHPRAFGLRENFGAHEETVPDKGGGSSKRLYYWAEPNHHCGWALVTAGPIRENPFIW
jgi:hypothetical protein